MHDDEPLERRPAQRADRALVLLHGRGRTAEEMAALADRFEAGDSHLICPRASGNTWYPLSFLAPLADNQPALDAAVERCETIVSGLLRILPAERIFIGGFSQGACLTAAFLHRHPRRYAGALLFTGGLPGPPGTSWPPKPELSGMPVYISTSEIDDWVPPWRVRETAGWFEASGAKVVAHIFKDRPHIVADEEIDRARRMMGGLGGLA